MNFLKGTEVSLSKSLQSGISLLSTELVKQRACLKDLSASYHLRLRLVR